MSWLRRTATRGVRKRSGHRCSCSRFCSYTNRARAVSHRQVLAGAEAWRTSRNTSLQWTRRSQPQRLPVRSIGTSAPPAGVHFFRVCRRERLLRRPLQLLQFLFFQTSVLPVRPLSSSASSSNTNWSSTHVLWRPRASIWYTFRN